MSLKNIFTIKYNSSKERVISLDIIRGILIILIFYHHSSAPYSGYVLQFHMPALFLLSGYTEYVLDINKSFKEYVKSKFNRLIVPYICFEILNFLLYASINLLDGNELPAMKEVVISILTCTNNSYIGLYGRLWFLPAMFFSSVFAFGIRVIGLRSQKIVVQIGTVLVGVGSYIIHCVLHDRLPFTIDTSFLGAFFFLIGYASGNVIKGYFNYINYCFDIVLLLSVFVVFVLCNVFADPICYMYINEYNDYPYMLVCALAGSVGVLIAAKWLVHLMPEKLWIKDILLWFSINSLATFPIHLTIKVLIAPSITFLGERIWLVLLPTMLLMTIPIVNLITTYFPFLLGDFRKLKIKRIR